MGNSLQHWAGILMGAKNSNIILKILKVLGWIVVTLFALIGILRLLIYTGFINNLVKEKIISIANESINGSLQIADLDGDLWHQFTATGIAIIQNDTLIQIDSLSANYKILSFFGDAFQVNEVYLGGLSAHIDEEPQGEFNIQNLVKSDTASADTTTGNFAFNVDQFNIRNSRISVYSPTYLPDSTVAIQDFTAHASFGMNDDFYFNLSSLQFQLQEGRLPEPVAFKTSANFEDQIITLNDLVIETSRSLLKANAHFSLLDSTIKAQAQTDPLSLNDIQAYLDEEIPQNKLELSLEASGSLESLSLRLNANGDGFDDLLLTADLKLSQTLELTTLGFSIQNVDLSYFDSNLDAQIDELQATLRGKITNNYENADLTWGFSVLNLRYEDYFIDRFFGSGTLQDRNILSNLELNLGIGEIIIHPEIYDVFAEAPQWNVRFIIHEIDPVYFTQNSNLSGSFSSVLLAEGKGFMLSDEKWSFEVKHNPSLPSLYHRLGQYPVNRSSIGNLPSSEEIRIGGQTFSDLDISGFINQDSLSIQGFLQLLENKVQFDAAISDFMTDETSFRYQLKSKNFDLSEIVGMDSTAANLNFSTHGKGAFSGHSQPKINGIATIDSSFVNGASLHQLSFTYHLKDNVITIPDGEIGSDIADGTFSVVKEAGMEIGANDSLDFNVHIKNLQPLAEFGNFDRLQAQGRIEGVLRHNPQHIPEFDGLFTLNEIRVDEQFNADQISGMANVKFDERYHYQLNLDISAPTISAVTLRDLKLITNGSVLEDSLAGDLSIQIESKDAGEIFQNLDYGVNLSNLHSHLTWNSLDFHTPARLLTLHEPFNIQYENERIQTDTLRLFSESGAYLNFAVPLADSVNQQVWLQGMNFDFGIIQEIIFGQRYVDGVLSGEVEAIHQADSLNAKGELQIRRLNYMDAQIDSLEFAFNIADERLIANGNLSFEGEEKMAGNLNVPFLFGNPTDFDDSFFQESVQGELVVAPIDLDRFEKLLSEYGLENTGGIVSFNGDLSGTAGEPIFNARLSLDNPTLSGIRLESAFAEFNYNHIASKISANAEIAARGQKMASIQSDLPISFNFQTFEVITPDEDDSIQVNLKTEDFNLSVFNDFLDDQYLAQLKGILNADVQILGTIGNLVPQGTLVMESGEVRVPIANITLSRINSEIDFTAEGLELRKLTMRSGGDFNAHGLIKTDGLQPVELDLTANARQFKLANTNDYNLTIDLESHLRGVPNRPVASGQLTVRNGFVYLQDFGERSVEAVQLEGEEESSFNVYDSLALDMNFVISRNFFVRNERYLDLEVELTGNLDAQKDTGGELQLFGSLSANGGYARPLGKHFELEEGEFSFSGPLNDPGLLLRTSYIPPTSQKEGEPIVLYYIIEGTAQEPVFRFESDPQMEQQDIIAYTIFGRPFYALDSWQQVMSGSGTGSTPTDLLVNVLLDEVEALATRELGIDVVQIDNTRSGTDAVTSIKTGWYLNRRTFFSIVNEISSNPKTLFILEYMLKENLDLIITQGDDNRQGIDLRWEYEY